MKCRVHLPHKICFYSGAPLFPNRSIFVNIGYVKGHGAAAAAPFYELCKIYMKKHVCIDVKRGCCNERILRKCAHEKQFVGKRYTPTCINLCIRGTWKERSVDVDFVGVVLNVRFTKVSDQCFEVYSRLHKNIKLKDNVQFARGT